MDKNAALKTLITVVSITLFITLSNWICQQSWASYIGKVIVVLFYSFLGLMFVTVIYIMYADHNAAKKTKEEIDELRS